MKTYISLLRGINVGGRIVKMVGLKNCYEKAGFKDITTVLQSGNVIFRTSENDLGLIGEKVEVAVTARFNYPAKIITIEQNTLKLAVEKYPFGTSDERFQHYLVFLRPGLVDNLLVYGGELDKSIEAIAGGDDVVYWKVQKGMTVKSDFSKVLAKPEFRDLNTVRNIRTLNKLLA